MQIQETVLIGRPREDVWALFQDAPRAARLMPGAELTEDKGGGVYAGRLSIRLGPFSASFEGEATHRPDPASLTGKVEGSGVDKRGGSRSRLAMTYALAEKENATELTIDAGIQLSGPVAQFGRTGIVAETARVLIGQFVANVEAALRPTEAPAPPGAEAGRAATPDAPAAPTAPTGGNAISLGALVKAVTARILRRLFGAPR